MHKKQLRMRVTLIISIALLLITVGLPVPNALGSLDYTGYTAVDAPTPDETPVSLASTATPSPDVDVFIDGNLLHLSDPVAIYQGRALVPMRHFFEALDADVSWDGINYVARGYRGGIEVLIPIWSNQPTVNGKTVIIDVPAQIWNDRTYIPLRFVGESLGDQVKWDGANRQIFITTEKADPTPLPELEPKPEPDGPKFLGSETVYPSDNDQTITVSDVKITIPGGVLDQRQEVSVSYLGSGQEPPDADQEELMLWGVKVGNMSEFRHPIVIEFPFDPAAVPAGEDPEGLFIGLRWDRNQNDWVQLPAGVDTQSQTVTVTTTSLSEVGWARLRQAHYVEDDRFIVYFRDDHQPAVYDEQGRLMSAEDYARLVLGYLNDAYHLLVNPQLNFDFKDPTDRQVRVWTGAFDQSEYNDRTGTISITSYQDAMLENRLPVPGSGQEGARHDVTHEYFHAIQNAYMTWTSMRARYWWIEATADYAAGGAMGTGLMRELDQEYFQNPIYYNAGDECMQMYETARFIEFLVEGKGIDFQHLWETSAEWYRVFDNLAQYIHDGSYYIIYREFARWAYLSEKGPASNSMNDMGEHVIMGKNKREKTKSFSLGKHGTAEMWSVKPEFGDHQTKRTLEISVDEQPKLGAGVDVLVLPDNQRLSRVVPQTYHYSRYLLLTTEKTVTFEVKPGETLYMLASNGGNWDSDFKVTVRDEVMDLQMAIRHLEQEQTHSKLLCTVQGLEGDTDRFHFDWSIRSEHGTDIGISASQVYDNHLETTLHYEGERTGTPFDLEGTIYTISVIVTDTETGEVIGRLSQDTEIGARTVELIPGL